MFASLLLALPLAVGAPAAPQGPSPSAQWSDLNASSPNGRYRAELRRAPGYESKPPELSRWRLTVVESDRARGAPLELWSCNYPYDGSSSSYLLSDDGRLFVHVCQPYQEFREVVTIFRDGRAVPGPTGSAFDLSDENTPRTDGGRLWLAPGGVAQSTEWLETSNGPEPMLRLECLGGHTRWLGLSDGRVWSDEDFDRLFQVQVEPALPDRLKELVQAPYVRSFSAPPFARAGAPTPIVVHADHPSPGWKFEGFTLEQSETEGRELTLHPLSRRPAHEFEGQVLVPLEPTAHLVGLVPGRYRVRVVGRVAPGPASVELEVLPADLLLLLRREGGYNGLDEEFRILGRGELVRRVGTLFDEPVALTRAQTDKLRLLVDRLPDRNDRELGRGTDRVRYSLTHWHEGEPVEFLRDDSTAHSNVTDILRILDEPR